MKILIKKIFENKLVLFGITIIIFLILLAFLSPVISPHDPYQQDLLVRLQGPSLNHLMGTDELGRDVFSRMLMGIRVSLLIGILASFISIVIGTLVGLISGYAGKWWDTFFMRLVDVMLCFPTLFLILMILAVFEKPSIYLIVGIIAFTAWAGLARMVRAEVLSVKEREYMLVAKGLGLSNARILFIHLLPNVISPILVAATLTVGSAILMESGLSFLGLGVQPPDPSWGNILTSGKDFIHSAWWLSLFPGLAILITVLGFNLLGEGLRDALDPKHQ
ncbi:MAG: ABC transporter permease [Elusimicrobiota bacterium]